MADDHLVATVEDLEKLYGEPHGVAVVKEIDHINDSYRAFIAAAPFLTLATSGPEGLDCSPRGDAPGFVRVVDERTLLIPDRRGNNRIDSLRNIVRDPRVAILFLIPGIGETLRIVGRARLSSDPQLRMSFAVNGKAPATVLVIAVERVFYQCSKAIVRSKLWDAATQIPRSTLPSAGTILAEITGGRMGGPEHDRGQPERIRATLY